MLEAPGGFRYGLALHLDGVGIGAPGGYLPAAGEPDGERSQAGGEVDPHVRS